MEGLFGQLEYQGRRDGMEDTTATVVKDSFGLWAVFDGHGGESCSQYCKEQVLSRVVQYLQQGSGPEEALEKAFTSVDSDYCTLANKLDLDDGSTGTVLLVKDGEFFLAAAGDSRAVLVYSDGAVEPLSSDHKPDRQDERQRVARAGGIIQFDHDNETYRIFSEEVGGLAVTRAIGDAAFKPYVCANPEITRGVLDDETRFIVLASDGLWDDVDNDEAGDVLLELDGDIQGATKELVQIAFSRGSEDNISVLAVDLQRWREHVDSRAAKKKLRAEEAQRAADDLANLERAAAVAAAEARAAADDEEPDAEPDRNSSKRKSKKRAKLKRTIPGLDEDGYLSELLLWRSPLRTLLWFSVGALLFFLSHFAGYTMLTLGSHIMLTHVIITFTVVKTTPMLKRLRLVNRDFDSTVFVLRGNFMSHEVVKRASDMTYNLSSNVLGKWNTIVQEGSATSILMALRFISYFFSPFPLDVVLFIAFVALFSLPATYHHNQVYLDKTMLKIDAWFKKLTVRS